MQESIEKMYYIGLETQIDEKMSIYLKKNHLQYRQLSEKAHRMEKEYPVIVKVMEEDSEVHLSSTEHGKLKEYLQARDKMEQIERQYYFYYGQSMAISYRWIIERLKKELSEEKDSISETRDDMLELLMEGRADMAEQEFVCSSKEYRDCIEEVKQYEKTVRDMDFSKEEAGIIDSYTSALIGKYILRSDYMYRCGMKDALILLNMIE